MKKQTFARYLTLDLAGNLSPVLGSDGVLPLDGRLAPTNAKKVAIDALSTTRRFLASRVVGIEICKGTYTNCRVVLRTTL